MFVKELRDALRDRRTLLVVVLTSVAMGPLVLVLLSALVAGIEQRAESREVVVAGIEHAPTLRNYLERQTLRVTPAPADYEQQLQRQPAGRSGAGGRRRLRGRAGARRAPRGRSGDSSANNRARRPACGRVQRALHGFNQESAMLRLAYRGVAPAALEAIAGRGARPGQTRRARAAQLTGMVPFFVLMAVLYGALQRGAGHHGRRARARFARAAADDAGLARWRW